MIFRITFAAVLSISAVLSAAWSFAPVSRYMSKTGSADGAGWFMLAETMPRLLLVSLAVFAALVLRDSHPKVALVMAFLLVPFIWAADVILWTNDLLYWMHR